MNQFAFLLREGNAVISPLLTENKIAERQIYFLGGRRA